MRLVRNACAHNRFELSTVCSHAYGLGKERSRASTRARPIASRGRPVFGGSRCATTFTGIFSTLELRYFLFNYGQRWSLLVVAMLISLMTTPVIYATRAASTVRLILALELHYFPLIALRLHWRRAGLISHVGALAHRGRCPSFLRDLFDSGQHWSLAAAAVLVLLIPLDIIIGQLFNAARATRASTRPARQTAAAETARAATVPFRITSSTLANVPSTISSDAAPSTAAAAAPPPPPLPPPPPPPPPLPPLSPLPYRERDWPCSYARCACSRPERASRGRNQPGFEWRSS